MCLRRARSWSALSVPGPRGFCELGRQGQTRAEREPALGPRASLDLSSVDGDALAHTDETVPSRGTTAVSRPVVHHRYIDVPVVVADEHLRIPRARVLDRVRQALLDDAIRRQVDA